MQLRRLSDGVLLDFSNNTFGGSVTRTVTLQSVGANWVYSWNSTGLAGAAAECDAEYTIDGDLYKERIRMNYAAGGGSQLTLQDIEGSSVLAKELTVVTRLAASDYDAVGIAAAISNISTLVDRLTALRAANLDNLDAASSTLLKDADYVAPDNAGIASTYNAAATAAADVATLLGRLTDTRAGYLDKLANYVAPDNAAIGLIYAAVVHQTYGLNALRTLVVGLPGLVESTLANEFAALAGITFPTEQSIADAIELLLGARVTSAANAATILEGMTLTENGNIRFTAEALKAVMRTPEMLDIVQQETEDTEVVKLFQVTKPILPPDSALGVDSINVYQSGNFLSDVWELLVNIPYQQGDTSFTFTTQVNGFYRVAFVAQDGDVGAMSDPFGVGAVYDLDFSFALEADSKKVVKGEQKYVTVVATDKENKVTVCPPTVFSVYGPLNADDVAPESPVIAETPALVDGMDIKAFIDTTDMEVGSYLIKVKVNTGYEVLMNVKPIKFSIING